ncbi:hypothetical protein RDI58_021686 [Solanum bulbocastanum]|uniref:MADS-box domain-containing protein n=1 Tax=Solanum bulbocastanum TaxID=147425 RepID=A0AAN8Y548_SOLBU
MAEKKTLGHQKILMAKIEDEDDLYSTFSKRCARLYKKASDMIEKYDIDEGIIIFFPIDNLSLFSTLQLMLLLIIFSPYVQGSEKETMD